MADLVADHAGKLGLARGERHQPARHIDIAARQRESVGNVAVEDGEGEFQVGQLRLLGQALTDLVDIGLQLRVVDLAAELLDDLRMLLAADLELLLRRHEASEARRAGGGVGLAAAEQKRARHRAGRQQRTCRIHGSRTSICSGCASSIKGPLRDLIQPRTRTILPSWRDRSRPAAASWRRIWPARGR